MVLAAKFKDVNKAFACLGILLGLDDEEVADLGQSVDALQVSLHA